MGNCEFINSTLICAPIKKKIKRRLVKCFGTGALSRAAKLWRDDNFYFEL